MFDVNGSYSGLQFSSVTPASSQTVGSFNSNFHVCVRIRPSSSPCFDKQGALPGQKYIRQGTENSILLVQPSTTQGDKVFIFDEVFGQKSMTSDIFEKVIKPNLAESLFKGFSHTILVYGMTGSGKTFTMFGNNNNIDTTMNPSTLNVPTIQLNRESIYCDGTGIDVDGPLRKTEFESTEETNVPLPESKGGLVSKTIQMVLGSNMQAKKVKVKLSYLEIYNEQIRDLLTNEPQNSDNLLILEDPQKGVYCPLLSEKEITSTEQIQLLIKQGNRRRVMASTKLNEFSSRSHAIIQLSLEIEVQSNERVTTLLSPKLYMVDLAGSERASTAESKGIRLKEGASINKSLLSLGNCITVLSASGIDKATRHVPYRDSKLTRLLKESLGGNAKTLLIACVTPAFKFVEETINTLKYAQRAKCIEKDVYENVKQIYNQMEKVQPLQQVQSGIKSLHEYLLQSSVENPTLSLSLNNGSLSANPADSFNPMEEAEPIPMTQTEIIASTGYRTNKEIFCDKFKSLSEHFEDILSRIRELEFNLTTNHQSKEQNQRLIHEIMDTIHPVSLCQKEIKFRIDKLNQLRSIVKLNEETIDRLHRELQECEALKESIKQDLEDLYEMKFVQECLSLSNFHLYNVFEEDKKKLNSQINILLAEKQIHFEEENRSQQLIRKLREEIEFIKRKAALNEEQHLDQQEKVKQIQSLHCRSKCNPHNSMHFPNAKTPRNNSPSCNSQQVQSKYLQFSTFVPSTNISANVVRERSANQRQSNCSLPRGTKQTEADEILGGHNYTEPNYDEDDYPMTSSTKEFREFQRKERIIEEQLGQLKNNLKASRIIGLDSSPSNQHRQHSKSSFKSFMTDAPSSIIQDDFTVKIVSSEGNEDGSDYPIHSSRLNRTAVSSQGDDCDSLQPNDASYNALDFQKSSFMQNQNSSQYCSPKLTAVKSIAHRQSPVNQSNSSSCIKKTAKSYHSKSSSVQALEGQIAAPGWINHSTVNISSQSISSYSPACERSSRQTSMLPSDCQINLNPGQQAKADISSSSSINHVRFSSAVNVTYDQTSQSSSSSNTMTLLAQNTSKVTSQSNNNSIKHQSTSSGYVKSSYHNSPISSSDNISKTVLGADIPQNLQQPCKGSIQFYNQHHHSESQIVGNSNASISTVVNSSYLTPPKQVYPASQNQKCLTKPSFYNYTLNNSNNSSTVSPSPPLSNSQYTPEQQLKFNYINPNPVPTAAISLSCSLK